MSCGRGAAIRALFDPECETAEDVPRDCEPLLFAQERACIERAAACRRAEFGTGRVCARRALSRLGFAPAPLIPDDGGAPRWPAGSVGSISHTRDYCAVVVARAVRIRGLGLDIEREAELSAGMIELICTEREQRVLCPRDAVVYFSAKEAFYKCQYPVTRRLLDFRDVELELDTNGGAFRARVLEHVQLGRDHPRELLGRWRRSDGLILCGVTWS